jgi:uncharacterized protein YbaP (TraB family)
MKATVRALTCLLMLAGLPAAAQAPAPQTPPAAAGPWSDITEVVVRARVPGPAMWKLTRGESTVWVMGTLHVSPKDVNWDATRFRRVLQGAHVLILPHVIDDWTITPEQMQLSGDKQLDDVVSARTYQRYQDVLHREQFADLPTGLTYQPAWAGSWLIVHVYRAHGITTHIIPAEVADFAAQSGVAVKYVDRHTTWLQARQYGRLDPAAGEACLDDYLDSIDHDLATVALMGKAWAEGDVSTILASHRDPAWVTCFLSQPKYARIYETYAVDDMVKAVDNALKAPGKSVAVMPLSDLLRRDGILDRLRAEGVTITAPAE